MNRNSRDKGWLDVNTLYRQLLEAFYNIGNSYVWKFFVVEKEGQSIYKIDIIETNDKIKYLPIYTFECVVSFHKSTEKKPIF